MGTVSLVPMIYYDSYGLVGHYAWRLGWRTILTPTLSKPDEAKNLISAYRGSGHFTGTVSKKHCKADANFCGKIYLKE